MRATPESVRVVAAPCDHDVAEQVDRFLSASDVSMAGPEDARPGAIVIVLSSGAMADPQFRDALNSLPSARLVPLAIGAMASTGVPERIAGLNWILWNEASPEGSLAQILSAARTDLLEYSASRSVEAKAWAWEAGGHERAELLRRVGEVKAGRARVFAEAQRNGTTPQATILNYLRASLRNARKVRRRRWIRGVAWTVLGAVVLVGGFSLALNKRHANERYQLEIVAHDPDLAHRDPAVQAIKVSALALDKGLAGISDPRLVDELAKMLAQPWPKAVVGFDTKKAVNELAPYGDGAHAWIASGSGALDRYDVRRNKVTSAVQLGSPLYNVDTTPDGSAVLASDANKVYLVRDGNLTGTLDMPANTLVISSDGRTGALVRGDSLTALDLTTSSPRAVRTSTWDAVLDVRPSSDDGVLALVRRGGVLEVIEVSTGHVRWRQRFAESEFEAGAVARSGGVAVASDGQLWWSDGRSPLRATGVYAADPVTAMALTSDGRIYAAADPMATVGYDARLDVPLPRVCGRDARVLALTLLPDERSIVCSGYGQQSIWEIPKPTRAPKTHPTSDPEPRLTGSGTVAAVGITDSGLIQITTHRDDGAPRTRLYDPTGVSLRGDARNAYYLPGSVHFDARPSTWTVSSDGSTIVVGSESGDVAEFDIDARGHAGLDTVWKAPDHAAVRSIQYRGSSLLVSTSSAKWRIPSCAGCYRNPGRFITAVMDRQLPCYASTMDEIVPERYLRLLHVRLCPGSGL